jgi:NAD+ synthase (glutamine-hydrolysing)
MQVLTVASASVNQTPLAWRRNVGNLIAAIEDARNKGAQILCLPELCITGYGSEDLFLSRWFVAKAWSMLEELLPATAGMIVGFGIPCIARNVVYNGYGVCADGRLMGVVPKQFLAGDGVHYEQRWFKPWPAEHATELRESYLPDCFQGTPIGDISFVVDGVRIAVEICEDSWVPQRPLRTAALSGVDLVMSPSASHFALGKSEIRRAILRDGARFSSSIVLSANLLGCESGKMIFDGDACILDRKGVVAQNQLFSLKRFGVVCASVDIDSGRIKQQGTASLRVEPIPRSQEIEVSGVLSFEGVNGITSQIRECSVQPMPYFEELWQAITLGLLDYAEKSSSRGFVVSLSGGADSASVASLVFLMSQRAIREIGKEELARRLRLNPAQSVDEMMKSLLACIYQKTANSSQATETAARELAEFLGCDFGVCDVEPIVSSYRELAENFIGRSLSWETDDTALQNIQARVRAPSVWMLANIRWALLLTTGNRSELSVGYATMDGDMCGGLNPIGGLDKPLILRFLRWLAEEGPIGYGPLSPLMRIISSPPTAELRPSAAEQTDETDLMPYTILQAIEREFVYHRRSPDEIIAILKQEYPLSPIQEWVDRYITLFGRNQWKRERAAPSFHLDDYSLDPRSWLRFPILSGGE